MSVDFKNSETRLNLMRAFAGESQARNRYGFAAEQAKNQNMKVIELVFKFTANQEQAHAKVFYDYLKQSAGDEIKIDGGYPVDINERISALLRYAQNNEFHESNDVYVSFGEKAKEEGFDAIAHSFNEIAKVEKIHGERFGRLAELLESDKLFVSDVECKWMCLNCGYTFSGKEAPMMCPVCQHDRGYFIRFELAPFTSGI